MMPILGPIESVQFIDQHADPRAQVMMGTILLFGQEHHALMIRVHEVDSVQQAYCDPLDRFADVARLQDGRMEPVQLLGCDGDWVICVFPWGR